MSLLTFSKFRLHNKPSFSQTIVLQNLYINPQNSAKSADGSHLTNVTDEEMQEHYDNFFEDCFVEAEEKYGEIEEMNVCDNLGDHLVSLHKPQICLRDAYKKHDRLLAPYCSTFNHVAIFMLLKNRSATCISNSGARRTLSAR